MKWPKEASGMCCSKLEGMGSYEYICSQKKSLCTASKGKSAASNYAHILLWPLDKIHPNDVDMLISAELPNPNEDPKYRCTLYRCIYIDVLYILDVLYQIIKTHMVHGPCGIV